jgi:hypothetical protein
MCAKLYRLAVSSVSDSSKFVFLFYFQSPDFKTFVVAFSVTVGCYDSARGQSVSPRRWMIPQTHTFSNFFLTNTFTCFLVSSVDPGSELQFISILNPCVGRNSSVAIPTTLRAGRSGARIPVEAGYSVPVQTSPKLHPAPYTMDNGSVSAARRPERSVNYLPLCNSEVKEMVGVHLYPHSGSS